MELTNQLEVEIKNKDNHPTLLKGLKNIWHAI